ncbi:hypothetical protein N7449_005831, partial [Penicillium cf. viridicatum]
NLEYQKLHGKITITTSRLFLLLITPSEEDSRPALDHPDGTPQMDKDGSLHLKGRQAGDSEHALDQQRNRSGASADRVPGPHGSGDQAPRATDFHGKEAMPQLWTTHEIAYVTRSQRYSEMRARWWRF